MRIYMHPAFKHFGLNPFEVGYGIIDPDKPTKVGEFVRAASEQLGQAESDGTPWKVQGYVQGAHRAYR
jgi:hypothetical protein